MRSSGSRSLALRAVRASWQSAREDFVYGITEHPVTGAYAVARYRLEFPDVNVAG